MPSSWCDKCRAVTRHVNYIGGARRREYQRCYPCHYQACLRWRAEHSTVWAEIKLRDRRKHPERCNTANRASYQRRKSA